MVCVVFLVVSESLGVLTSVVSLGTGSATRPDFGLVRVAVPLLVRYGHRRGAEEGPPGIPGGSGGTSHRVPSRDAKSGTPEVGLR